MSVQLSGRDTHEHFLTLYSDTAAKVPTMGTYLANIQAANKAGASPPIAGIFVVYDLPDRDCAAAASNGEFTVANNGVANYKAYIDSIVKQLKAYPDVHTILIIGTFLTLGQYPSESLSFRA